MQPIFLRNADQVVVSDAARDTATWMRLLRTKIADVGADLSRDTHGRRVKLGDRVCCLALVRVRARAPRTSASNFTLTTSK